MSQPNRRFVLQSSAAACTAGLVTNPLTSTASGSAAANGEDQTICLTNANDFYTVARGKPKPHTLKGDDLVNARMTPESWQLEIDHDTRKDPPVVSQLPSLEKRLTLADGSAIDYDQLVELGRTKGIKFIKAIQCLNIPTPLGQGLWEGVPLCDVLRLCGKIQNVRRVYYWGFHNNDPEQIFQSSLSYTQVFETPPGELPVFLAYKLNGEPITPLRGGPVRVIVPWAYGFKSIKWLHKIVLTNDPRANDTYATQNNDPDSPLKTAAYLDRSNRKQFNRQEAIEIRGLVISGLSGLDRVEFLVRRKEKGEPFLPSDSREILNGDWTVARIQKAPSNWKSVLPEGVSSRELLNFDSESGEPASWPLRYGMTGWSARLEQRLEPGQYEFRVRSVDENGHAQPEPRPTLKSGRNEIQVWSFKVT